jgi:hypothetical protein
MFTSKIVWDWTGEVVERVALDYVGPVDACKGSSVANDQRKQELDMQKQAFNMQQKQLSMLNDQFGKYLTGNVGFDPQQLGIMRSQFLNQNSNSFNDAGTGLRQALASRGIGTGDSPVGGEFTRGLTGLYSAGASNRAGGLANIDLTNLQQMLTNKFNAGSILSGNAATLNGAQATAGQGASNALSEYMKAENSGFGASFMRSFGSGLGGGLAAGLTGGAGGAGA